MASKNKENGIGSLPGGRRGTSTTGGRRDRMQASRPATPPGRSDPLPSTSAGLAPAGPSQAQQSAPATGGTRRMRWPRAMNEDLMRAFYRATGTETGRTGYRAVMHREFLRLLPELIVSEQNLADRVRYIQRSGMFSATELERLRSEVVPEADPTTVEQPISDVLPNVEMVAERPSEADADGTTSQDIEHMRSILEGAILEIRRTPLEERPKLPRLHPNVATRDAIEAANGLLPQYLEGSGDLGETSSILFAAALAVCRYTSAKMPRAGRNIQRDNAKPAWKRRIERRITQARVLIGRLLCFREGNTRPRIMRSVKKAFAGTGVRLFQPDFGQKLTERIDDLKQKVAAWGKRLRRYSERVERYQQNRLFMSDQRKFYRNLERPKLQPTGQRPETANFVAFWRQLWSEPVEHEEGAWMHGVEEACARITPMNVIAITQEDVVAAIRRAPNWKSPGIDGLQHYWLKAFSASHATLAVQFQSALENRALPNFLTTGITHLAPKTDDTADPSKYRPITCLTTIYKTLTSVLSAKISRHVYENKILSSAQNGCRGGSRGSKELLLIDAVAGQVVKRNRRNFSAAWIDYKKAFDSVPHSWLRRILELYKIDGTVRVFLETCMGQWTTILSIQGERLTDTADRIEIKRGIFQGDCLSPLWFCLSLNPLSTLLENSGTGFQYRRGGTRVSHLLYMDDLKLLAPSVERLTELLTIVNDYSSSVRMALGIDKCAVLHVQRGRVNQTEGIVTDPSNIKTLSDAETYRYLGMSQNIGVRETDMKQSIREEFFARLTRVLKSSLSGANKIRAYNGWVIPVLLYTFGVLRWSQTELEALDRKVRTTMTLHRMHHPKSSVMRLYIPRKAGGRGLLSVKTMHNREIDSLRTYFLEKRDEGLHREVIECDKGFTPLSLAKEDWRKPEVLGTSQREAVWKEKELHGRFFKALHGPYVNTKTSVHWLQFGDLFGETEGFVCAIQDQVVKTNNYRKHILKDGTEDICRACRHPGDRAQRQKAMERAMLGVSLSNQMRNKVIGQRTRVTDIALRICKLNVLERRPRIGKRSVGRSVAR
ncbi:uncharacterized protein LOC131848640 [Achroia grisella]|uniref:uncharacterized protein LOC131848640 n=1 Tax=Achroia grisella TaxID=688607 RepID=UPI0027D20971|nr:uncharacterized protein LOC131848640 [Achroia grisella]